MDRNLGANRVAMSFDDEEAYGDLYQWGRAADGHEKRNSSITSILSSTDVPGHGNYITTSSPPYDWRFPQNDNLWQEVSGINNPCPAGFRLPTEAEFDAEQVSWDSNDSAGAFTSPLKLVVAGSRPSSSDDPIRNEGSYGYYWTSTVRSSTVNGDYARYLRFGSEYAIMDHYYRAWGYSVRCIKDSPSTCDSTHLSLCTTTETCASAGGYWWSDNTCNSTSEPTPIEVEFGLISSLITDSLCYFNGDIYIDDERWYFSNCDIYGYPGNILYVRVRNKTTSDITVSRLLIDYPSGIDESYGISPGSEIVAPSTSITYVIYLSIFRQVNGSDVTVSFDGYEDIITDWEFNIGSY